ncbi:MAG: ABC transporter substrate-binding protein [Planctomycetota bacterium]
MAGCGVPKLRIVSLLPAATETIYALGLGERLVGVSHACRVEGPPLPRLTKTAINPGASSGEIHADVETRLAAGEPLFTLDADLLEELRPDLVVTQDQCEVCALPLSAVTEAARAAGRLDGAAITAVNPRSLDDVLGTVEQIAAAAGELGRGEALVAEYRERIARVEHRAESVSQWRSPVAVIEWREPLILSGNWCPELIWRAGGESVLVEPGQPSRPVAWEELIASRPEAVFVVPCGFDRQRAEAELGLLRAEPGWGDLPAAGTGRYWALDGDRYFNSPGPGLVATLEHVGGLLGGDR